MVQESVCRAVFSASFCPRRPVPAGLYGGLQATRWSSLAGPGASFQNGCPRHQYQPVRKAVSLDRRFQQAARILLQLHRVHCCAADLAHHRMGIAPQPVPKSAQRSPRSEASKNVPTKGCRLKSGVPVIHRPDTPAKAVPILSRLNQPHFSPPSKNVKRSSPKSRTASKAGKRRQAWKGIVPGQVSFEPATYHSRRLPSPALAMRFSQPPALDSLYAESIILFPSIASRLLARTNRKRKNAESFPPRMAIRINKPIRRLFARSSCHQAEPISR